MSFIMSEVILAQERVVQTIELAAALPNLSLSPLTGTALGWV